MTASSSVQLWHTNWKTPRAWLPTRARHALRGILRQYHYQQIEDDFLLAATELLTNAITHALPPYHIALNLKAEIGTGTGRTGQLLLELRCRDQGPHPTEPGNGNGLGILLIQSLTDSFGYQDHKQGGTVAWFTKRITAT